jgi:uncharacterized protein
MRGERRYSSIRTRPDRNANMTRATRRPELSVSLRALERAMGEPMVVHRTAILEGLCVTSARVPPGEEVRVDVVLEAVHGGVLVSGTVSARWVAECSRCLEPARGTLLASVRELFEPGGGPEDMTYPLGEDEVDLEPMAREQCVLGLPLRPLCRPECRGLCTRCGANLNEGSCGCPPERDPRWSALDSLLE